MVVDAGRNWRKNNGDRTVAALCPHFLSMSLLVPLLRTFEPFTKLASSTTLCEVLSGKFHGQRVHFCFGEESSMNKTISRRLGLVAIVVVALLLAVGYPFGMRLRQTSTMADAGPNHQTTNTHFGVSGGNVKDISALFCCSGTLGSLLTDGNGSFFILSNNHVLARSDAAALGEAISEPGLVDNQCRIPPIVANLTSFPLLSSNVDAAIAKLGAVNGQPTMDTTGFIEDIGTISATPVLPTLNMAVKKSGRTTGLTTGSVTSFNTNVRVQYQARCGQGRKFTISFTDQVVVAPGNFSAGGDSGSLILTTNNQPVGLLFAGSSTTTIANPICEVLAKVNANLTAPVHFVGSGDPSCPAAFANVGTQPPPSHKKAHDAKERYADQLMSRPGVIGVGVGNTEDDKGPAVIMYMDANTPAPPFVPAQLDGVPVRVIRTDAFVSR